MYKLSVFFIIIGWAALGCSDSSNTSSDAVIKPVSLEKKTCEFCLQEIRSARYGGEITGQNGERLRFRSIECLAGFVVSQNIQSTKNIRVINFIDATTLLTVEKAIFIDSPNLGSPNGMNFAALDRTNPDMMEKIERAYPGEFIEWPDVVSRVVQSGYALNQ